MKMFVQEGDVFHIEEELKEDPTAMIMPSDGITSHVSNYPVNEMNLNFDYMHVSSGNDLNTERILNDEHLINEEDEAKIKPIENETIKINLGTLENPKKVKISSTLSSEEQEEPTKLLKEFPEVFAWSYEDMLGINPDIVQHQIPRGQTSQAKAVSHEARMDVENQRRSCQTAESWIHQGSQLK